MDTVKAVLLLPGSLWQRTWNLSHPPFSILAEELSFRRERPGLVKGARDYVPKLQSRFVL